MKAVGIRELKARLSEYVRLARAGEVVLVTDRGEVVAELAPPRAGGRVLSDEPGLEDLVARGLVSPGAGNDPRAYPELAQLVPEGESSRLLEEERGG